MPRLLGSMVVTALVLLAAVPAASAQTQRPAKPQTTSLDSEAPRGAPPHWLPNEEWVMEHWLPYDEQRLHRLLGVDRGDVWRWLRDDTRTLADLARRHGWEPAQLARALVAPWKGQLDDPARLRVLERRALRTLTQGHLSQHILFHSLHQQTLPDNSTEIFGVGSREEWSHLRRSELSPLQICRLNGLTGSHAQRQAEAHLRGVAAVGVREQHVPKAQVRRLLARQLRQLPRWLQQSRYNGPPPVVAPRVSPSTASNYSNNAVLSRDGRHIAFEAYEANVALAKSRGEISVMARGPEATAPASASSVSGAPNSAYNPAISADGRWVAFESADANLNFAKRYGQMRVLLRDLKRDRIIGVSHPPGSGNSRSAYNPTISGDGRVVAFEAYEQRDAADLHSRIVVSDRRGRHARTVRPPSGASDAVEPTLSSDGRTLAFTALVARGAIERSQVFVRDLVTGRTRRASDFREEAWAPALSADGSVVAYTATAEDARSSVVVRDLSTGDTTEVASPYAHGLALEPSLSDDGRRVAFVARPGAVRQTQVFVHDVATGRSQLVSRGDGEGGAPAMGSASRPAISGDGRRVAFTSDAWNLSEAKCNSARGIFVRDLERGRTRLASVDDGANRYLGPTRGSSGGSDAFVLMVCA